VLVAAACSQNPVLGDWEIDPSQTGRGAILAAEATDLAEVSFRRDAIAAEGVEIPVSYVVEENRVRLIREDGRGEHLIEVLPDGKIRVELPIGVVAVYRKARS
jgi:hypothetical protein